MARRRGTRLGLPMQQTQADPLIDALVNDFGGNYVFALDLLEEYSRILNKHRDAAAASKISFTHLVAWAIVRALDTFPRLNDAYDELEAQAHRIQRDQVRLGIAVDVQKKDGSRTLLVPNIK